MTDSEETVYCEKHNISYSKELEEIAEKRIQEARDSEYPTLSIFIFGCPLCTKENTEILSRSMVSPEESAQCRRLTKDRYRRE